MEGDGQVNGDGGGFTWGAVLRGAIWGLGAMLAGGLTQGLISYYSPPSAAVAGIMSFVWQAVGGLAAGFVASRRASGGGWLHGAAAGMLLIGLVIAMAAVQSGLPRGADLAQLVGIACGSGAVGGIAGVNTRR